MDNKCKDTNHTMHIARRVHKVRNGEKYKMHMIDWCEGGLQLAGFVIRKVSENGLKSIMKYIMVRFDN